jgi:hypothetical protein
MRTAPEPRLRELVPMDTIAKGDNQEEREADYPNQRYRRFHLLPSMIEISSQPKTIATFSTTRPRTPVAFKMASEVGFDSTSPKGKPI